MPPKTIRRLTKDNIEAVDMQNTSQKKLDEGPAPAPQTTHAQMRRPTLWNPKLMQLTGDRRMSMASRTSISGASGIMKPPAPPKYENTYKMQPDGVFQSWKAKSIMAQTLKDKLAGMEYSVHVRRLTTELTEEIKKRVKALGFTRYKYVVTVTICQDTKQSMQIVSRCLWNKETDSFAEASYKTNDIYALATVYACYYE